MYMAQKAKKKSKMRHAEYYDMQKTFDDLYAGSKNGEVFGHLMEIISAPNNIKLAFRNIKGNDGSHTAGTDGRTIESLAVMPEDKFVKLIQKQFRRYEPKAVRRVEIPKPNGKLRPLGIPCIIDRIVQQCILQVMEPICEAKFYEHSYGFRPCRSAENAIAYAYGLAQMNKLHYVVDVDVKGFFDNVDHRKLLKQIWTLGIRDTKLIQIIKAMLKAPIEMPNGETVLPSKGTPQGGILSPLLANIVLNELDWWIASQWDEMVGHMKHPCKVTYYPNGAEKKCNSYTALKKSNLKEMRIVRYADDFKIFCRTKEDAEKTYHAVKDWLWKRLKLEVSDEKSKVTNLRKRDSEFLGFRIKLRRKGNSWVITSNVCDKATQRISREMAETVRAIQSSKTAEEISLNVGDYNAKVIGVQDYYCIATRVNLNFSDIARPINGQLLHRIDGIKKQGEIKNRYLRKRYGKSKQMRWVGETPLVPLAYVQFKIPMRKSRKINPYTPEGRAEIHDNLRIDVNSMLWLMRHPIPTESVRYNDNRVSLYAGQDGKCAITGKELDVHTCVCYRKAYDCKKGKDSYQNLMLLSLQGLAIVSSDDMASVAVLVKEYSLNAKAITKVNKLRATAGLPLLAAK
ncbi:MAG: group II intron reverse transcriptase/maturase [Solobacterium sp.]|nr:group II intron reverse transcriptase/maturase [Solobacterium sp.]